MCDAAALMILVLIRLVHIFKLQMIVVFNPLALRALGNNEKINVCDVFEKLLCQEKELSQIS